MHAGHPPYKLSRQLVLVTREGNPFISHLIPDVPVRLYMDESGVGGMQFAYLTIGILYCPRADGEREAGRVFARARRHWLKGKQRRQIPVFRASSTPPTLRTRIIGHLAEIPEIAFVHAAVRKPPDYPRLEARTYSALAGMAAFLMRQVAGAPSIEIAWKPGTNKLDANVFGEAFTRTAHGFANDKPIGQTRIAQRKLELHQSAMLQAVDFFTNAIWRNYERGDGADAKLVEPITKHSLFIPA